MIDDLVEDLKRDEGWRSYAYLDTEGFLTIGYGFLIDEKRGGELPRQIGETWLLIAATKRWNDLVTREPWLIQLPEDVQRALGNMAYQLGVNGVLKFRKMIQALRVGDREEAADEALDSRWAEQTPNRAKRVAAMIRGNEA